MKPIVVIGELNGSRCYETLKLSEYEKVIFLGNIISLDNSVPVHERIAIANSIFALRRMGPGKIIIIPGYSDLQFLFPKIGRFRTADANKELRERAENLFLVNSRYLDFIHQDGRMLFCYGGITDSWLKMNAARFVQDGYTSTDENLGQFINRSLKAGRYHDEMFDFMNSNIAIPGPYLATTMTDLKNNLANGLHQYVSGEESYESPVKLEEENKSITFTNTITLNVRRGKPAHLTVITNTKK